MTTYECKRCGAPAEVKDGEIVRTCECADAVTANLTAHATGQGGANE